MSLTIRSPCFSKNQPIEAITNDIKKESLIDVASLPSSDSYEEESTLGYSKEISTGLVSTITKLIIFGFNELGLGTVFELIL